MGGVECDGFRRNYTPGTGSIAFWGCHSGGGEAPRTSSCDECSFFEVGKCFEDSIIKVFFNGEWENPPPRSPPPIRDSVWAGVHWDTRRHFLFPNIALSHSGNAQAGGVSVPMEHYHREEFRFTYQGVGGKPPLPSLPLPSSRAMPQPLQRLQQSPLLL